MEQVKESYFISIISQKQQQHVSSKLGFQILDNSWLLLREIWFRTGIEYFTWHILCLCLSVWFFPPFSLSLQEIQVIYR